MSDTTFTITLPKPRLPRVSRTARIAVASALAGAAIAAAALVLAGSGSSQPHATTFTGPNHAFHLSLPTGWRGLSGSELARLQGRPLAVLRSRDGRGVVVIQSSGPVRESAAAMTKKLTDRLSRSFKGFKPIGARFLMTRAGTVYLYTFVRAGAVESIAIATTSGRTYTLDGVVRSGADDVAQQVGAIVGSFGA